jgi:hypothetical protein
MVIFAGPLVKLWSDSFSGRRRMTGSVGAAELPGE